MKAVKIAGRILTGIIVTGISIWAVGALYYSPILGEKWRAIAAGSYAAIVIISITIHGVRNFDYRTETELTPRWETRTYDLSKLDSVDLIAVYWAGKAIAHVMMSFGFAGKDYVTVSIETRKRTARVIRHWRASFANTSSSTW